MGGAGQDKKRGPEDKNVVSSQRGERQGPVKAFVESPVPLDPEDRALVWLRRNLEAIRAKHPELRAELVVRDGKVVGLDYSAPDPEAAKDVESVARWAFKVAASRPLKAASKAKEEVQAPPSQAATEEEARELRRACPLKRTSKGFEECAGERCAWFVEAFGECALKTLARSILVPRP